MAADVSDLVKRAQAGDQAAFEELVLLFQRPLFYTVLRIVGDAHTADDLTQEAFLKAYESLAELETPEYFKAWIFRIATNKAIDVHRTTHAIHGEVPVEDLSTFGATDPEPQPEPEHVARVRAAIEKAVAELPAQQRAVLTLTVEQGLAQEEIAKILDCPVGTVKSRLHHARRFIKARIERLVGPL
jgi:RNA polymerase sigma-70 factor (ECF subfamily)